MKYRTYILGWPRRGAVYLKRYTDGTTIPYGVSDADSNVIRARLSDEAFTQFLATARELGMDAGLL